MSNRREPHFQFALQDLLVAVLCLGASTAFLQSLEFTDDRHDKGTASVVMLILWATSTLLAINFRSVWLSKSSWYIPPFVLAGSSIALMPYNNYVPVPLSGVIPFFPAIFFGVTAYYYMRKTRSTRPWVWSLFGGFGGLMIAAMLLPPLVTPRWVVNQWTADSVAKVLAEAQELYRRTDYDGDGIMEYAATAYDLFEKTPGTRDVELIDKALAESDATKGPPKAPKAGYYVKLLKAQSSKAEGGAKQFVDANGNMTGGYAFVVYPAEYGKSGRATFIINDGHTVYYKDLGPGTQALVDKMTEYDPDTTWKKPYE